MGPERVPSVDWHGTEEEIHLLFNALSRNCACGVGPDGTRQFCGPHLMLLEDQRALDGLLFARRTRARWIAQELQAEGRG